MTNIHAAACFGTSVPFSWISYTEFKTCCNILEYMHSLYAAFTAKLKVQGGSCT